MFAKVKGLGKSKPKVEAAVLGTPEAMKGRMPEVRK